MIDQAKILISGLEGSAKAEMSLLINAVVSGMKAYQEKPTAGNKRNWDVARDSLAEAVQKHQTDGHKNQNLSSGGIYQTYKNRAEALRFVRDWGFGFSERKFYDDCVKEGMIEPDGKSVNLCSIIAYLWKKYPPVQQGDGFAAADEERIRRREALEDRKLEAEVAAAERKGRKEDDEWMEVVDHERQMAAFAGLIEEALNQQATLKLSELIYKSGGDINKGAKFHHALAELFAAALTEAVRDSERELEFEEDIELVAEETDAD